MRRLALIAAASLGLGVAVIVDQPASFAHHLAPKKGEFRSGGNLAHTNLKGVNLNNANLSGTKLSGAIITGTKGCPRPLPSGWVCKNNSLIQR